MHCSTDDCDEDSTIVCSVPLGVHTRVLGFQTSQVVVLAKAEISNQGYSDLLILKELICGPGDIISSIYSTHIYIYIFYTTVQSECINYNYQS